MAAAGPLILSDAATVSEWLGGERIDDRLLTSLQVAREIVTGEVDERRFDADDPPESLHRAATMIAAAAHRRTDSVYGVEAYAVGGESGPGVLLSDPTVDRLLRRWRTSGVGASLP